MRKKNRTSRMRKKMMKMKNMNKMMRKRRKKMKKRLSMIVQDSLKKLTNRLVKTTRLLFNLLTETVIQFSFGGIMKLEKWFQLKLYNQMTTAFKKLMQHIHGVLPMLTIIAKTLRCVIKMSSFLLLMTMAKLFTFQINQCLIH
jgi:hypothetical protein